MKYSDKLLRGGNVMLESLYDLTESSNVNFVGCVSEENRFDFAIVYTNHFFGKPLVVCMQTGRSAPMCADDLKDLDVLRSRFLVDHQAAHDVRTLLQQRLPTLNTHEQY
jgi:uracil phosphoribosyltransferase